MYSKDIWFDLYVGLTHKWVAATTVKFTNQISETQVQEP